MVVMIEVGQVHTVVTVTAVGNGEKVCGMAWVVGSKKKKKKKKRKKKRQKSRLQETTFVFQCQPMGLQGFFRFLEMEKKKK